MSFSFIQAIGLGSQGDSWLSSAVLVGRARGRAERIPAVRVRLDLSCLEGEGGKYLSEPPHNPFPTS